MEAESALSGNDSESDPYCTDDEEHPGPSKRQKVNSSKGKRGAALYRTKFQVGWRQKWLFAVAVKNCPHSFCCTVCNKVISCGHQGSGVGAIAAGAAMAAALFGSYRYRMVVNFAIWSSNTYAHPEFIRS
jgi:hypothetical protein